LDVDLYLIGQSWTYTLPTNKAQFLTRAYYGHEFPRVGGDRFNSKHLYGGQFYALWTGWEKHTPYLNLTVQEERYNDAHPLLLDTRHDQLFYTGFGWSWIFRPNWLVKGEYIYTRNHSNLDIFKYSRDEIMLTLQYQVSEKILRERARRPWRRADLKRKAAP